MFVNSDPAEFMTAGSENFDYLANFNIFTASDVINYKISRNFYAVFSSYHYEELLNNSYQEEIYEK